MAFQASYMGDAGSLGKEQAQFFGRPTKSNIHPIGEEQEEVHKALWPTDPKTQLLQKEPSAYHS